MKKLMIAMVVAAMSFSAMAQTTDYPVRENSVQTNGFWDNWFVQVSPLGIHADNFKFGESTTYNATVAAGKWFTPGLGLRGQFHLPFYKLNDGQDARKQVSAYAQVMFNLSNMFCGYKADRLVSFVPYVGFGRAFSATHKLGVWSPFTLGLIVPFQVWDNVSLDLEASVKQFNNIDERANDRNWMTGLNLNLTWYLPWGKQGFEVSPDMAALTAMHAAQLASLNEALSAEQAENKNLKEQLAKKPKEVIKEKIVKEVLAAPQSVFFAFNSAKIASKKEILNLESLANMAKNNGAKLKVTGYADSATGVPAYNQQLSERRAKAVAKELVKLGVAEENIVVEGKGGVADVKPASYNRRVIIEAL